jgi:Terminase-like family.
LDWCDFDTSALLSEEQRQIYKETMPPQIYLNEIEGEFIDAKSELWNIEPVLLREPATATPKQFAGLDWATGSNNDETVLSIFNSEKQMVALFRWKSEEPTEQIKQIIQQLKAHNVTKLTAEKNSIGDVYLSMLKKAISDNHLNCVVIPFDTTNTTKRQIIEHLQVEINNQTIRLLDDNTLKLQFVMFEIQATPTGKITYGNQSDKYHDDIVISVALAINNFKTNTYAIR